MKTTGRRITLGSGRVAIVVAAWRGWPHIRFYYLFAPLGRNAQAFESTGTACGAS